MIDYHNLAQGVLRHQPGRGDAHLLRPHGRLDRGLRRDPAAVRRDRRDRRSRRVWTSSPEDEEPSPSTGSTCSPGRCTRPVDLVEQHQLLDRVAEMIDEGTIQTTLTQRAGPDQRGHAAGGAPPGRSGPDGRQGCRLGVVTRYASGRLSGHPGRRRPDGGRRRARGPRRRGDRGHRERDLRDRSAHVRRAHRGRTRPGARARTAGRGPGRGRGRAPGPARSAGGDPDPPVLRGLLQLRAWLLGRLPAGPAGRVRRGLRVRGHGPVPRRPGRPAAGAVRGRQLHPAAGRARRRRGKTTS